jgi:hypothetical protein
LALRPSFRACRPFPPLAFPFRPGTR